MLDSLHGLMQSIMTMYKIARYYGTPQRMTTLFQKITNQMMRGCKQSILASGKVWDQEKTQLIANMKVCNAWSKAHAAQHACGISMHPCMCGFATSVASLLPSKPYTCPGYTA
jgi:dynein heavy chain